MEDNIPTRETSNSSKQTWITNKAKKLCRQKKRWYRKSKRTNLNRVKNKYLDIKSCAKSFLSNESSSSACRRLEWRSSSYDVRSYTTIH